MAVAVFPFSDVYRFWRFERFAIASLAARNAAREVEKPPEIAGFVPTCPKPSLHKDPVNLVNPVKKLTCCQSKNRRLVLKSYLFLRFGLAVFELVCFSMVGRSQGFRRVDCRCGQRLGRHILTCGFA
ncbi:MAG: hypothetical protein LBJ67_02650 [Planctomycetaceae bacterium]|nr:hypothetical protein [Planctomycetaceae bacterium]